VSQQSPHQGFWTEERFEEMKRLWMVEGYSASHIAAAISAPSRNAILAKLNRAGLLGTRVRRKPRTADRQARSAAVAPPPPAPKPEEPVIAMRLDDGARITVMTVDNRMCRFPIGDPAEADFHFCGWAPKPGSPYCSYHHGIAFVPIKRRASDDEDVKRAKAALKNTGITRLFG